MKPIADMTPQEKMALCLKRARRIVKNHRKKIPVNHLYKATWVAAGVAVAGAVAGGVQAHNAAKDAEGQALEQSKRAGKNKLPGFNPPNMPGYTPFNFDGTQKDAIAEDVAAYKRSDRDFATRHAPIVDAERIFEDSVLKDQKGDSTLLPAIQSELTRAGIAGSLDAFGDTGATLAPGSAGEANVARNLGIGVMNFQDRNRKNRMQSLVTAEDLFPRREFGMNGEDKALTALSDTVNQNAFNQGNYAAEVGAYEKNYEINAANQNNATTQANQLAAAQAAAKAERAKAMAGAITSGVGAIATGYGKSQSTSASPSGTFTYSNDVGAIRPGSAKYPGANGWVPVGKYAA